MKLNEDETSQAQVGKTLDSEGTDDVIAEVEIEKRIQTRSGQANQSRPWKIRNGATKTTVVVVSIRRP